MEEAMTAKTVSPKFVDLENVKESLATGMTVVHPYAPGLIQIIFTTPRHWSCPRLTGHRAIVIELA